MQRDEGGGWLEGKRQQDDVQTTPKDGRRRRRRRPVPDARLSAAVCAECSVRSGS